MRSLRLPKLLNRLLRHVLWPLLWAGVLGAIVGASVARHFTSEAFDRSLLDDALMMAGHVHEREGELDFRLTPSELKAVLFDQSESLFFTMAMATLSRGMRVCKRRLLSPRRTAHLAKPCIRDSVCVP